MDELFVPLLSRRQQRSACEIYILMRCLNIDFSVVLGHTTVRGILELKMMFDYTKWIPPWP